MTQGEEAPILTGQHIGEAEGALTALLERALRGTGLTRSGYITLQVLDQRGPFEVPADLHGFLADARQLRMEPAEVTNMLEGLERAGLVSGTWPDSRGPAELTEHGRAVLARVREEIGAITTSLLAGFDAKDLEATRRVLVELVERAKEVQRNDELGTSSDD